MYCEDSAAAHIDHFRPRSIDPLSTFTWENYLLACSICNSNYKRDAFPVDHNGEAVLLDPTVDEPADHLQFSPTTGRYDPIPGSAKADESIRVFGLNRSLLEQARRDAWRVFEFGILGYDNALVEGRTDKAEGIAELLRRLPFAGVFRSLIASAGGIDTGLVDPACRAVVDRRPEILVWRL